MPLRAALDRKDTDFVVKFIKDNNLTADVSMRDKRTPLMYSSFRNDVNTSNALINLGAGIRAKDRFGLSPMAYAIMLNSVDTAKVLLGKGVKFEEVEYVSPHTHTNRYYDSSRFESIIINGENNITIHYKYDQGRPETDLNNPQCVESSTRYKSDPFKYLVDRNLPQMAELMLSTGYKPKEFKMGSGLQGIKDEEKNRPLQLSGWAILDNYEDYEPMLEVFIKYDLPNAPTKEQLKEAYEVCYKENQIEKNFYEHYEYNKKRLDEIIISQGETPAKVNPVFFNFRKKLRINHYEKYCPDENSTFTIREFIDWANDNKKMSSISSFTSSFENDPTKVIYIDNNRSKSGLNSNLQSK